MKRVQRFGVAAMSMPALLALSAEVGAQDAISPERVQKMQPYIACINRLSERAYQTRDRYISWAGDEAQMAVAPQNIYGLYEIADTGECVDGVEAANAAEPDDAEIEAAASDYVASVVALEAMLGTAYPYYERQDYKDNDMAKGQEMHSQLLQVFADFEAADIELREDVETFNDALQAAQLAELEESEGRSGTFLVELTMSKALEVVRLATAEEMTRIDLPQFTEAVAELEAAVDELGTYASGADEPTVLPGIVDASNDVLVSAKGLMRRVRDETPFTTGEAMLLDGSGGAMVEGSQPELVEEYNSLIDSYNRG